VVLEDVICLTGSALLCLQVPQRLTGDDQVRKIVKEEGRTARNLVTWNVPLEDQGKMPITVTFAVSHVNNIGNYVNIDVNSCDHYTVQNDSITACTVDYV